MPGRKNRSKTSNAERRRALSCNHLYVIIFILTLVVASGCVNNDQRGDSRVVEYSIQQPHWIASEGRRGIPDVILERRIANVVYKYGSVWFGAEGYGLAEYHPDSGKWTLYPVSFGKQSVKIWDIVKTENGLIAGTAGLGLFRYDMNTGKWTHIAIPGSKRCNEVRAMVKVGNIIWIATFHGLCTYDISTGEFRFIHEGRIYEIQDSEEGIWALIDSVKEGRYIARFDKETAERKVLLKNMGKESLLYDIYVEDSIVLATAISGFFEYDKKENGLTKIIAPDTFPYFIPRSITKHNDMYIAGGFYGLTIYDKSTGKWYLADRDSGLHCRTIYGVASDAENIYIGSERGPFIITPDMLDRIMTAADRPGRKITDAGIADTVLSDSNATTSWIHITTSDGLINNNVFTIETSGEEAWIGTNVLGVSMLNTDDFSIKNYNGRGDSPFSPVMVREIAVQGDSVFHGGQSVFGEFDRVKNKWLMLIDDEPAFDSGQIEALWAGKDEVWLSAKKDGIRVLNRKTGEWRRYPPDPVTLSNVITDIVPLRNRLWISSDIGLRMYDPNNDKFKVVKLKIWDISSIAPEGDTLWLGAVQRGAPAGPNNTGLYRYNTLTKHEVAFNRLPAAGDTPVTDVFVDGPSVWMANGKGISRYCRLTGRWNNFGPDEKLDVEKTRTVAVAGDMLLVGTDNGLYIKKTIRFSKSSNRRLYIQAWNDEANGDFHGASVKYNKLMQQDVTYGKNLVEFRLASCLQLSGKPVAAMRHYENLLLDYPLLVLSLEEIYTSLYGFDAYIQKIVELKQKNKNDASIQALCRAYLEFAGSSLKRMAIFRERQGRYERAVQLWRYLVEYTDDPAIRKNAEKRLLALTDKQHVAK